MILPDANLLLYVENSLSQHHDKARTWWGSEAMVTNDKRMRKAAQALGMSVLPAVR